MSLDSRYINREYECRGSIDLIQIISRTDGIRIMSGDADQVKISYWENPGKFDYDLSESDGKLLLSCKTNGSLLSGIHYTLKKTMIEVTVPKSFTGALDLQCASGEVKVADVNVGYLKIGCKSGSIQVTDVRSRNEVRVENTSGSIKLCNISSTDITASDKSGSIHLEDIRADGIVSAGLSTGTLKLADIAASGDITVSNKSGVIKLERISTEGSVDAGNTSGGIHFYSLKTAGNITLKSTSGSVKGSIIGKESDYSIRANAKTGLNNLKGTGTGSKELNVKTTSGSIKITFI